MYVVEGGRHGDHRGVWEERGVGDAEGSARKQDKRESTRERSYALEDLRLEVPLETEAAHRFDEQS